jgi:hypothetical protein
MALTDFFKKAKKKVADEVGQVTDTVSSGISSLGKIAKSYRDSASSKVGSYFTPTENVRVRDFAREFPRATVDVGKSLFGGTIEVAKNAPKIIGEGLAYAGDKNVRKQYKAGNTDILPTVTEVTPTKMLADTGRSLLEVGTLGKGPKWAIGKDAVTKGGKAVELAKRTLYGAGTGYGFDVLNEASEEQKVDKDTLKPGINTLAGGVLGAAVKPATQIVKEGIDDLKVAGQDIKNLLPKNRTTTVPATTETISREIKDTQPGMGTFRFKPEGGVEKVDGFDWKHKTGKFEYPEEKTVAPWKPESSLINGLLKPGMRTQAVKSKVAAKNDKAKEVVQNQIEAQKKSAPKAQPGFVMPKNVSKPSLTGNPEQDFMKTLEATTPIGQPSKPVVKTTGELLEPLMPTFNKFQQEAFKKKQERIREMGEIANVPHTLSIMGFTKKQAESFGVEEGKLIAELGKLGYPKNDPLLKDVRSETVKRILRNKVPHSTLSEFYARKKGLDTNITEGIDPKTLKDIKAIDAGGRDIYRNVEAVFGENAGKVKERLLRPFDESKGAMFEELNQQSDQLYEDIVKTLGIKKGSNLSAVVQMFGEGKMSLETLKEKFPREWPRVVKADQWFRNMYDSMLDETNRVREFYFPTHPLYPESTKIIPKRDNYYRHFKEMGDGVKGLLNMFDAPASIDPALAVSSQYTKPSTKWLSFAQKRTGDKTEYDAVGGFIDYLKANAYAKHIDPHIQRFRGVDKEIRSELKPGEYFDNGRVGLAEELANKLDPFEQIAAETDVTKIKNTLLDAGLQDKDAVRMAKELSTLKDYGKVKEYMQANLSEEGLSKFSPKAAAEGSENNLNVFLKSLDNFANDLAGKTNPADRPVMDLMTNRKGLRILSWINSRTKANMIVGNAGSTLAQPFSIPLAFAEAGPINSAKAVGQTLLNIFNVDAPTKQSRFLRERFFNGFDKFDTGTFENSKKFAVWMTSVGDKVGSVFSWNALYNKALADGVDNPVAYVDELARKMIGGRGIGEVPMLQKSKTFQLFLPFQLEVANFWHVLRDWAAEDPYKTVLAKKLLQYSMYVYVMNRVVEELRGSDVAFDPIEALLDAKKSYEEADNRKSGAVKAAGRVAGEVISNFPGGQTIAGLYPEYGNGWMGEGLEALTGEKITRSELFGEGDPTRFGSGLLVQKGFQDAPSKLLLPYGGAQVKKTYEGAKSLLNEYAETSGGQVMTPVDKSPYNIAKGLLFGKNALQEVQDFRENERTPLTEDQTEKFLIGGKRFYNDVMDSRDADKEREALKVEKVPGTGASLDGGIHQLKDGTFYVPELRADTKTFKTEEMAKLAIQKEDFEDSDEAARDLGDIVLRKKEDGTVYPQRKDIYTTYLLTARMTGAKKNDNFEEWTKHAEQKYELLSRLVSDPTVDELDRAEFQNQMMTLEDDMEKYAEYGGHFKKGRAPKKLEEKFRYPLVDAELSNIENGLKSGVGQGRLRALPRRAYKAKLVKSKQRRKRITV